jgi:formate transporter
MIKAFAPDSLWTALATTPQAYAELTTSAFFANLIPVTIGNIVGGGVLVGAVYWFVYLRKRPG